MHKKAKKIIRPKIRWIIPVSAMLFTASILASLQVGKERSIELAEPLRPVSEATRLGELPAMGQDLNLYDKNNRVAVESGLVRITHPDGRIEEVGTRAAVVPGDRLEVGDGGNAEILWFEGSVTRLAAGTEIEIREAGYNAEDLNKTRIGLWANRGKIWAKVIKMVDGESEFKIESTSAIAGVRGTTFNFMLADGRPVIEVIENEVFLQKKDDGSVIQLSGGQTGALAKNDQLEVRPFDPKKLEETYYAQNIEKDRLADEKFKEANRLKIMEWAKPLPGELGYIQKQERIQDLLDRAADPVLLEKLKARAEKLKVYEAIALADPMDLQAKLNEEREKIQKIKWPDGSEDSIKVILGNHLKHIERALVAKEENAKMTEPETSTNVKPVILQPTQTVDGPKKTRQVNRVERTTEKPEKERSDAQTLPPKETMIGAEPSVQPVLTVREKIQANREALVKRVEDKKRYEAVQEKIRINREGWLKRVEERLRKEAEVESPSQEGMNEGRNADEKNDETGAKNKSDPNKNMDVGPVPENESNVAKPDNPTGIEQIKPKEEKGGEKAPIDQPKEDKGQGVPQSDQPKEHGVGEPNEPGIDIIHGNPWKVIVD